MSTLDKCPVTGKTVQNGRPRRKTSSPRSASLEAELEGGPWPAAVATSIGDATPTPADGAIVEGAHSSAAAVVQDSEGVWRVRGHAAARAALQAEGTRQAGFLAEQIMRMPSTMRLPILFQEGRTHREQRIKTAPFFTPAATDRNYRDFMESYADELVAELQRRGRADLSELSMRLAVQVAARVVGLTNSVLPGMDRRIESFFRAAESDGRWDQFVNEAGNQWRVLSFYTLDVAPAIRARRRQPREDLITHLISEGYTGFEILTECITFAAAGMVTTREFISVAAWHFLEHPDLQRRYVNAEEKERHGMLHELLRLEPVVGHLLRRAEQDVTVETDEETVRIPEGALIDIHIYDANADESAVGPEPLLFCPERERGRGVLPYALSFGHGHHRCPGAFIAIQETDIFLTKLLALDGLAMVKPPAMARDELVQGYELRDFIVQIDNG